MRRRYRLELIVYSVPFKAEKFISSPYLQDYFKFREAHLRVPENIVVIFEKDMQGYFPSNDGLVKCRIFSPRANHPGFYCGFFHNKEHEFYCGYFSYEDEVSVKEMFDRAQSILGFLARQQLGNKGMIVFHSWYLTVCPA